MHELSATQQILAIALKHAKQANADKITGIHLLIGDLSSIVDDSVQYYWSIIAKNTIAEDAELKFTRLPTRIKCSQCKGEYELSADFCCPECASSDVYIISGDEFKVTAIDIIETERNVT